MVKIDFRFLDIEDELWMLSEYLKMLQSGLPKLLAAESGRIQAEVAREEDPEVASSIASYLEERVNEGATVRFMAGSAFVAAWASYEAGVTSVARHIAQAKALSLAMSDLRGDFLTRARRYFEAVLSFQLHPPGTDWEHIKALGMLRHALAHANGRVEELDPHTTRVVESLAARHPPHIAILDGNVIISLEFVQQSLQTLDALLRDLIARAKAAY